jgi:hypothetical protein
MMAKALLKINRQVDKQLKFVNISAMGFADFPMPIMEPKILVFFTYY